MEAANRKVFSRLISYTKRHRMLYAALFISMFVGIGLELSVAQYLSRMTNTAASGDQSQWVSLLIAGAAILVLTVIFQYGDAYLKGAVSSRIRRDLRDDTMGVVLRLTQSEFDRSHSGELTARMTNDNGAIGDLFGNTLLQLIRNPLLALAAFAFLLNIYWPLALICFFIGPTTLLIGVIFGKPIMRNAIKQQRCHRDRDEGDSSACLYRWRRQRDRVIFVYHRIRMRRLFCYGRQNGNWRLDRFHPAVEPFNLAVHEFGWHLGSCAAVDRCGSTHL